MTTPAYAVTNAARKTTKGKCLTAASQSTTSNLCSKPTGVRFAATVIKLRHGRGAGAKEAMSKMRLASVATRKSKDISDSLGFERLNLHGTREAVKQTARL